MDLCRFVPMGGCFFFRVEVVEWASKAFWSSSTSYGQWPFYRLFMIIYLLKMVFFFHSYVKSPEGSDQNVNGPLQDGYSAAVLDDGKLFTWGCNGHGRCTGPARLRGLFKMGLADRTPGPGRSSGWFSIELVILQCIVFFLGYILKVCRYAPSIPLIQVGKLLWDNRPRSRNLAMNSPTQITIIADANAWSFSFKISQALGALGSQYITIDRLSRKSWASTQSHGGISGCQPECLVNPFVRPMSHNLAIYLWHKLYINGW